MINLSKWGVSFVPLHVYLFFRYYLSWLERSDCVQKIVLFFFAPQDNLIRNNYDMETETEHVTENDTDNSTEHGTEICSENGTETGTENGTKHGTENGTVQRMEQKWDRVWHRD